MKERETDGKWVLWSLGSFLCVNKHMQQVSSGRENPINDVVMVDPLEAKRLAAKQMQQLKAKEKFQVSHSPWLCMFRCDACWVHSPQFSNGILH